MNEVYISGNLVRDFEFKTLPNGTSCATNTVAVNKTVKEVKTTQFIDITCWAKTAEIVADQYKKGDLIVLNGELHQDKWEKDGQKHSKVSVWAKSVVFTNKSSELQDDSLAPANNPAPKPAAKPATRPANRFQRGSVPASQQTRSAPSQNDENQGNYQVNDDDQPPF